MTQSNLLTRIEAYRAARFEYDTAKKESDRLDKLRRLREAELVDTMLKEQCKKHGTDDYMTFSLVNSVTIGLKKEDFNDVRKWLLETIGDDSDFVETVVSKSAVLEHVKKKIVDEKFAADDFPAFLHCDTRPSLRVLGWPNRR